MRILITGGAGFIGSHIVDAYIKDNHDVIIIDDLSTGNNRNINSKAKFYNADIRNFGSIASIISKEKPQIINHHAAQTKVSDSVKDSVNDANINILGLLNILNASKNIKINKFIFASSGGAIYGDTKNIPTSEKNETFPISPYGVSKKSGELYLNSHLLNYNVPYIALRYSNVYGPRQISTSEGGVISIFINKLLQNYAITINGDGKNTRDYVNVNDVVSANVNAIDSKYVGPINIGTGIETSTKDIYLIIKNALQSNLEPMHGKPLKGEQEKSLLDCKKALKKLNWKANISLKSGIAETIKWFKDNT